MNDNTAAALFGFLNKATEFVAECSEVLATYFENKAMLKDMQQELTQGEDQ